MVISAIKFYYVPSSWETHQLLFELTLVFSPVRTLQPWLIDTKSTGEDISGFVQALDEGSRPEILRLVLVYIQ
jgi:hypothetical protein